MSIPVKSEESGIVTITPLADGGSSKTLTPVTKCIYQSCTEIEHVKMLFVFSWLVFG